MANYGALGKFGMSLGRMVFERIAVGTKGLVELAEKAGVKMDALQDSSPEDLMSVMDSAVRQRLIDPRDAYNVNIELTKDAQRAAADNVASFADAQNNQMASKIKGVLEDMPYTMNLPYEIGQKLNSEGKLPLPIGTNLLPIGGKVARKKGYPDEVHQIIGYKGDVYNPDLYGYEVQAPNGDIFFQAISDPRSGLREQRADKVGSFTAALGPQGLEGIPFVPPSRPIRQAVEKPQISEADRNAIDQQYNDLFGGPE